MLIDFLACNYFSEALVIIPPVVFSFVNINDINETIIDSIV